MFGFTYAVLCLVRAVDGCSLTHFLLATHSLAICTALLVTKWPFPKVNPRCYKHILYKHTVFGDQRCAYSQIGLHVDSVRYAALTGIGRHAAEDLRVHTPHRDDEGLGPF